MGFADVMADFKRGELLRELGKKLCNVLDISAIAISVRTLDLLHEYLKPHSSPLTGVGFLHLNSPRDFWDKGDKGDKEEKAFNFIDVSVSTHPSVKNLPL